MKSFVILISQLALTFALAGVVFWAIDAQIYLIVGVLVAVVTAGLMVAARDDQDHSLGWFGVLFGLSLTFGSLWPSLPIAVVWGGAMSRRRAHETSQRDASFSSDQKDQ